MILSLKESLCPEMSFFMKTSFLIIVPYSIMDQTLICHSYPWPEDDSDPIIPCQFIQSHIYDIIEDVPKFSPSSPSSSSKPFVLDSDPVDPPQRRLSRISKPPLTFEEEYKCGFSQAPHTSPILFHMCLAMRNCVLPIKLIFVLHLF